MCQQLFSCVFFDWDLTLAYTISDVSSPEERLTAIFQTAGFPYSLPEVEEAFRKYNESVKNGQLKRNGDKNTQEEIMQFYKDILVKLEHLDPDSVSMNVLYNAYANLDVNLYDDTLPLFRKLKEEKQLYIIYITHDLATAYYISDYIGVMLRGCLVEVGPAEKVLLNPLHPYTVLLKESVPNPDEVEIKPETKTKEERILEIEEFLKQGCKFAFRCSNAKDICKKEIPPDVIIDSVAVKCWLYKNV